MLSEENLKIIEYLADIDGRCMPADERPLWVDPRRLSMLQEMGLVGRVTLVPPGREGYADGLCGFQLLPAGVDALEEHYHQQEREDELRREKAYQDEMHALERAQDRDEIKKGRKHDILVAVIEGALTFIAGILVEERFGLMQRIYDLLGIHK